MDKGFASGLLSGLVAYAAEVGRQLDRDLLQPEKFEYPFTIDAAGVVTLPNQTINVREGFFFAIHTLSGVFQNPAVNNDDLTRILYQLRDEAQAKDLFRTQGNFARLFGNAGAQPLELRIPYIMPPGGQLSVAIAVAAGWLGTAKRCVLIVEGDIIRVDFYDQYLAYLKKQFEDHKNLGI